MKEAINNEIKKKYIKAVEGYENEIGNQTSDIAPDSFINLAFLYWCFAFELFEFDIPNNISKYWSNIGGYRFSIILKLGLTKYPHNVELHFWEKYFSHISLGKEFTERDCLELIKNYEGKSLTPYFFLYQFDKEKYKKERNKLLREAEKMPTAKYIYIKSLIV